MGEDREKKGREMTPAGSAASESPERSLEQAAPPTLVPVGPSKFASQRRSQRVHLRTAVVVYGQGPDGNLYEEATHTLVVNANGALILLAADVKPNKRLLLLCQQTKQQSECYVAWIGDSKEGKKEIGVGFMEPAPLFWGVNFPPEDWDSARRKMPTGKAP